MADGVAAGRPIVNRFGADKIRTPYDLCRSTQTEKTDRNCHRRPAVVPAQALRALSDPSINTDGKSRRRAPSADWRPRRLAQCMRFSPRVGPGIQEIPTGIDRAIARAVAAVREGHDAGRARRVAARKIGRFRERRKILR
jgi:hypothetical protein